MSGIALLTAAVADALTAYSSPIANSAAQIGGMALAKVFQRRLEVAREILLDELKRGDRNIYDVAEIEDLAAVTYRYTRAAQEGTARLNLRLMAKVIAGQAHLGNLVADEFLSYADLIASLRRDEVILVATMHRLRTNPSSMAPDESGHDLEWQVNDEVNKLLVPKVFPDEGTLKATLLSLTRTGLLLTGPSRWDIGFFHSTSPLMDRLARLASFEAALRDEGIET